MGDKKHTATTERSTQTYQVYYQNELIVESSETILLREHYDGTDFPPVVYFPETAVEKLPLKKSTHQTRCPIKGQASYWSYQDLENAIWSYETPIELVSQIKGYFGFDSGKGFSIRKA